MVEKVALPPISAVQEINLKVLPPTYNLPGLQDRTGLPGQRCLKRLDRHDLHHSAVSIETIHILTKLQGKKIIRARRLKKKEGYLETF